MGEGSLYSMDMNQKPLVTVLMTVYNGGDYLKASVQSILNQTFKDFEFLIVNDCSTDDSVKTIESFNDKRIIIHNNEKNIGQTKSLNVGLKLAKGKYIARMDADDMAFPPWLEKLSGFMSTNLEYDVVSSGAVVIDKNDNIKYFIDRLIDNDEIMFTIFFHTPLNHVGSMMNKETILSIGGYNESFSIVQDYELWSSLIRKGKKITSIADYLVAVRIHNQSLTGQESNAQTLTEPARTIFENIKCLTNLTINYNEAINLRRLFDSFHVLSSDEFAQTIKIFTAIYNNLKINLNEGKIKDYIEPQIVNFYSKKALHEIAHDDVQKGRETSKQCLRNYGFYLIPFAIYLSSFLGKRGVNEVTDIYYKILQMKTRYLLQTKYGSLNKLFNVGNE